MQKEGKTETPIKMRQEAEKIHEDTSDDVMQDWATSRLHWANMNAQRVKMVRNHCRCAKYQRQKRWEAVTICDAPSRA